MARKSFFNRLNAGVFFLLACIVTLFSSCEKNDVGETKFRETSTKGISYTEKSTLTPDNTQGTAHLSVFLEKFVGDESQGKKNADVVSKCVANVETDPVETANMEKTFVSGEITDTKIENSVAHQFTCDIAVNGDENLIKTRVTITPDMAWDRSYDCKVTKVAVAKDEVKIVETSKKSGEKARQAISAPVDFTIEAIGTEEPHSTVVRQTVIWEQYQLENTPVIDHEELDSWSWIIKDGMVKVNHHIRQIWTGDHEDTFVDYPAEAPYSWNTISLEDKTVKAWKAYLTKIEGLSVGTPYAVESAFQYYNIGMREDLYSALHETEGETKCVYFFTHPKFTFKKGNIEHVCDFISPSFSENGDDLLDANSTKSGYDLKVFRNAVTVKYGNAETGIDERVLEERQNLYKAAKAVKDIDVLSKTKAYPAFAVDYTVKYRLLYNDDTTSDELTATTSRPWSISYDGAWSMTATGEVTQSTTAIVLTKGESKTEKQEIANGYWNCTSTDYTAVNKTTVDGKQQTNGWKIKVPTKMVLNLYGTDIPFDEDAPTAEAKDIQINLTNSTATSETYKFSENLNVKVGTDTEVSEGTGTVTKAVEITVTSWEWNADRWVEGKTVKAFVERIYHMSDGSTKTVRRDFSGTINSNCYTYFETTEVNNSESTGAAEFVLVNTESKTEGDWKFDYKHSQLNFGITYAGSTQKDGWNIYTYDNLSCTIDGETYTFTGALDMSATANSTQTKKSEDDSKTTYEHSNAATFYFGGSAINLDAAKGLIFVNKTVVPEHHDGFFPKEYGKMEGYNRVACRNPHNQKDYGVGISVKFTNGSVCGFITKDGNIEWGSFEAGSTTWDGASPDSNGTMMNVTAKDASTAMKWMRNSTINMLSYSDGTLMGFNWGNNTVYTDKFGGNIEQKDGGKYQVLTISGVNGSWDSSY